jgi:hypothetical protein
MVSHNEEGGFKKKKKKLGNVKFFAGATVRFVTGRTSKQPEASFASACSSTPPIDFLGRSPAAFLSSNHAADGTTRARWRLSRIECHRSARSAISPVVVVEPLSSAEQVTVVNPQPYFVPSTASAAEILTHVAIQDLLFASSEEEEDEDDEDDDAGGFYDSSISTSSTLVSVSSVSVSSESSCDTLVDLFAHDGYSDLDSEGMEGEDTGDELPPPESSSPEPSSPEPSSPEPEPTTDLSNSFRDPSEHLQLPSPVHTNEEIRHTSTSVVQVTCRNTRPDSPGDDHGDGEQATIIPAGIFQKPYPHPHRLSPIIEEEGEEDCPSPETGCEDEDEDDTSDAETIRPSTFFPRPGLRERDSEDAGMDGPSGRSSFPFPLPRGESTARVRTDRRMSI